jgi:hypothetical protein
VGAAWLLVRVCALRDQVACAGASLPFHELREKLIYALVNLFAWQQLQVPIDKLNLESLKIQTRTIFSVLLKRKTRTKDKNERQRKKQ